MRCQEPFNALMRRRHHCRACGYVSTHLGLCLPSSGPALPSLPTLPASTSTARSAGCQLCQVCELPVFGASWCPRVKQVGCLPHSAGRTQGSDRLSDLFKTLPKADPIHSSASSPPFPKTLRAQHQEMVSNSWVGAPKSFSPCRAFHPPPHQPHTCYSPTPHRPLFLTNLS